MGTLGKGHFAKVKEVVHIEAQESYAVKILDKSHAENDVEDMVREFQMLRALRHPNIIRLYAAYESPHKLYLVTELASGGELMKRLATTEKTYSEDAVRDHIRAILTAVQYMHEKGCVHRDIKPENVLLGASGEAVLVDFGLALRMPPAPPGADAAVCLTAAFAASRNVFTAANPSSLSVHTSIMCGPPAWRAC